MYGWIRNWIQFTCSVQFSLVQLFATPWTTARQASLSITNSRSLPKLMSLELVMPSNHLILCHPLFLLPSIFPSIRVFSNESVLHIRWLKYWSFSSCISPSSEYSGPISLLQGTLKSLLQHHSSKASILWHSAFFVVQLSHPYMTIGKTIALTRWTFVGPPPLLYLLQTPILMQSSWATYYMARSFAIQLCVGGWSRLFLNEGKFFPEKLCSLLMRFF